MITEAKMSSLRDKIKEQSKIVPDMNNDEMEDEEDNEEEIETRPIRKVKKTKVEVSKKRHK